MQGISPRSDSLFSGEILNLQPDALDRSLPTEQVRHDPDRDEAVSYPSFVEQPDRLAHHQLFPRHLYLAPPYPNPDSPSSHPAEL